MSLTTNETQANNNAAALDAVLASVKEKVENRAAAKKTVETPIEETAKTSKKTAASGAKKSAGKVEQKTPPEPKKKAAPKVEKTVDPDAEKKKLAAAAKKKAEAAARKKEKAQPTEEDLKALRDAEHLVWGVYGFASIVAATATALCVAGYYVIASWKKE